MGSFTTMAACLDAKTFTFECEPIHLRVWTGIWYSPPMSTRPPSADGPTGSGKVPTCNLAPNGDLSTLQRSASEAVTLQLGASTEPSHVVGLDGSAGMSDNGFSKRYELGAVLGEGGMGEVRLCRDLRIGRDVALKAIRPSIVSHPVLRWRFEREARIQGQLEHPSVVPVYDLGLNPQGSTYFTMKRLHGLTLEQIIARLAAQDPVTKGAYSRRKLLSAFSNVCLAVAFAHAHGVVHRDLKPANIILGEFGEAYILDWGVAKVAKADLSIGLEEGDEVAATMNSFGTNFELRDTVDVSATTGGSILGTPGYMAPEQMRGETDAVDGRADIYALGTILFELITLQPLHPLRNVQEMMASTLLGADARVSARSGALNVGPELDAICVRATQLKPEARFSTVREMHDAIERYLDGERDLAQRREMAERHAREAQQALAAAQENPSMAPAERSRALRELNSALALDPTHSVALATMMRMMMESTELAPEAVQHLARHQLAARVRSANAAMIAIACCLLFTPLVIWGGVRSRYALLLIVMLIMATAAFAWVIGRKSKTIAVDYYAIATLTACWTGSLSVVFGSLVLVSGVAVACSLAIAIAARANRCRRFWLAALNCLAIVVPLALQWVGVLPQTYAIRDGQLVIMPWAVEFSHASTLVFLLLASLASVLIPIIVVGRSVDTLAIAERRFFIQAWNLRQLVPDEAKSALPNDDPFGIASVS